MVKTAVQETAHRILVGNPVVITVWKKVFSVATSHGQLESIDAAFSNFSCRSLNPNNFFQLKL